MPRSRRITVHPGRDGGVGLDPHRNTGRARRILLELVERQQWDDVRRFPPDALARLAMSLRVPSWRRNFLLLCAEEWSRTPRQRSAVARMKEQAAARDARRKRVLQKRREESARQGKMITVHTWDYGDVTFDPHLDRSICREMFEKLWYFGYWDELRKFPPGVIRRMARTIPAPRYRRRFLEICAEEWGNNRR